MNILLDAYFDRNFGDDVFIKCITNKFPNDKFYAFLEYYPKEVCDWAEKLPNLYLLPECNVFLQKNMFDAYICVGGDIFPDGGDFTKRKSYVKAVKECGGAVAYLGFSMFHEYSDKTKKDICEIMEQADLIAPRDGFSVELLQNWMPHKTIRKMADLAFSYFPKREMKRDSHKILGISVRRPGNVSEEVVENYCIELSKTINVFLEKGEKRQVRIFSLSKGLSDDTQIADRILKKVTDSERVEHFIYNGETEQCYDSIGECDVMICTRLHAMIAAMVLGIKCVPIVYEVKQEHILKETGYAGEAFPFHDIKGVSEYVEGLLQGESTQWENAALEAYFSESENILNTLEDLLCINSRGNVKEKSDTTGVICEEKQYAQKQVEEVRKKNHELEECQNSNKVYLQELEVSNKRNEEYFTLIEKLNSNYRELERVKDEYIASLNDEKRRLDSVIAEKQQEEIRLNELVQELNRTRETLQLRNQELEQDNQAFCEQQRVLEEERQRLQQNTEKYEEVLGIMRPYFISAKGSFITRQMSNLLELKEKGSKENWEKIQEFYQ